MKKGKEGNPFVPLDEYERDRRASIAKGEWRLVEPQDSAVESVRAAARHTIAKTERMNIRISKRDLMRLKERALRNGLPYQTLVGEIIAGYLNSET
jgi:predicted DNA binding CopG/RHH family protein